MALVLPNEDCPADIGRLTNTYDDATKVEPALRDSGFAVTKVLDDFSVQVRCFQSCKEVGMIELSTAQIGRCGELLVQMELLRRGIESSSMTTDTGIDLVAYSPITSKATTIQVKTNLKPKFGSGATAKPYLNCWVNENCPAELLAIVDLSETKVWLFPMPVFRSLAQQNSSGRDQLYFYRAGEEDRSGRMMIESDLNPHLFENRVEHLFMTKKPNA